MNNWQTVNLGELGDFKNGANFTRSDFGFGHPIINVKNLYDGRYVSITDLDELKPNTLPNPDIVSVQKNDILFARSSVKASGAGQVAMVNEFRPKSIFSGFIIRFRITKDELVEANYLNYLLRSSEYREILTRIASGTTITNLSQDTLSRLPIRLPSLSEQRTIAGILGVLDDKIELNRRMNRTLESMARAVFRELMKDVEEQGSILEFANLLSGGTPSTAEESYWNGNIEWVSAKDVGNVDSIFLLDTEKKITPAGVDNSSTKLLPAKTTIITARGTVGAHCILGKPMTMNQTNYGLKAKEGVSDYFVYFTLSEMVEQLQQQSYGTIFDTITTKTFQSVPCVQPPIDVIQKFEDQVTPLMDAILNNQKESRVLASLRDTLLPKLMRGEVRVKDIKQED